MALRFRLKGLAETFVESICCPKCGTSGSDDEYFATEMTKVTFDGIVVVVQCRRCREIFVPATQRMGVLNPQDLANAVRKDQKETGETELNNYKAVCLNAQKLNAERKGEMQ